MSIVITSNDQPITQTEASAQKTVDAPKQGESQSKDTPNLSALETESVSEQNDGAGDSETPAKEESKENANEESSEPSQSEQSDGSEEEDTEAKEESEKPTKKKSGFQKRVDKLNQRIAERDRELEFLRRQLMDKTEAKAEPKAIDAPKADAQGRPSPDHFETHAEYIEAVTDWKLEQKLKSREAEERQKALQAEQMKRVQTYSEKVESFKALAPDFDEVLEDVSDIPVSSSVRGIILESENGPELAYRLAKERSEFERINKLPPLAAARELGKLEARISLSSQTKTETKTKLSKAPKPIAPVGAGKGSVSKSLTDPTLSQREYEQLRREQMKRRRA